ncbi:hypothetical protein [Bdellovibrio bacteriovorus]|uniref:hypothetical protein n=1 Tax=Bdellovibrio bacteriovorus TaxID=959 RepID=UPI0011D2B0E6|nr:hypothetical protein [Bdellovibrio bacteriovorus]
MNFEGPKFEVSKDQILELCEIVDNYSKPFLNQLKSIDEIYKTSSFERISRTSESYCLAHVNRQAWEKIKRYSRDGYKSSCTLFELESGGDCIHVYNCNIPRAYKFDACFSLYPNYKNEGRLVQIYWSPHLTEKAVRDGFANHFISCFQAFIWLIETLIPESVAYSDLKKQSIFNRILKKGQDVLSPVHYLDWSSEHMYKEMLSKKTPLYYAEKLQIFCHGNRDLYVSVEFFSCLIDCLIWCCTHIPIKNLDYICGNFGFSGNRKSIDGVIRFLDGSKTIKKDFSGSQIDYYLRSLCAFLDDAPDSFDQTKMLEKMHPMISLLNREKLLSQFS